MENTNLVIGRAFEEAKKRYSNSSKKKKYFRCRDELLKFNAVDIAELLEEKRAKVWHADSYHTVSHASKSSVEVFAHFDVDDQVEIINIITDRDLNTIEELDFDDMMSTCRPISLTRFLDKTLRMSEDR